MYLHPIGVLRWLQLTRLGWSGVTQNEVALDDGLMTYLASAGYWDHEPVVLIHGLGPNAALLWRGVIPPLAEGNFKVIAPNLFGFASSEHKQIDYSIAYQAGAIAQMIDRFNLGHVNVIGDELGADVALYYAVEHPDKVERLILISGGLIGARGAAKLRAAMIPATVEGARAEVETSFFGLPPMPEFMYERMMAALANDRQAETAMLNSVVRDEAHIRSNLGRIINTLTIVMWSGRNPRFSNADGQALHVALPGSATVIFKTSGPYPQLEHPADFAEALLFILKQTEGGR